MLGAPHARKLALEEHLDEEWQSAEQRAIAMFDSVPGSDPPPSAIRQFDVMRAMSVNTFLEVFR